MSNPQQNQAQGWAAMYYVISQAVRGKTGTKGIESWEQNINYRREKAQDEGLQ